MTGTPNDHADHPFTGLVLLSVISTQMQETMEGLVMFLRGCEGVALGEFTQLSENKCYFKLVISCTIPMLCPILKVVCINAPVFKKKFFDEVVCSVFSNSTSPVTSSQVEDLRVFFFFFSFSNMDDL